MATRKTAALDGSLIVHKGEAVPARAAERMRESPIAVTVKLDAELYWELKRLGMRTKPRTTNQHMIVEAITEYVQRAR